MIKYNEKKIFGLLKFFLFLGFIKSMNFYWFWYINSGFFYLSIFIIILICLRYYPYIFYRSPKKLLLFISLFFLGEIYAYDATESSFKFVSCFIYAIIISKLLFLKDTYKQSILLYFTKYLALIIVISFPLYLIILAVGFIPSFGKITYEGAASIYNYYNYGILLMNNFYYYRFHAVFCEPGHLGMVIALLLYANKFKFDNKNKYTVILLIGLIFTFSLAAYVLCVLGFLLTKFQKKISILHVFTLSLISFLFIHIAQSYNNGKNLINELILERLEFDEERGISGNNRVNYGAQISFLTLTPNELLHGIGKENTEDLGASGPGFQVFIMRYGAISYLIIFLFYLFSGLSTDNKKEVFGYIFLFYLLLLQRSYPYWMAFTFIYIAITRIKSNENRNNKFNLLAKY